jgi:hypothetical protein
MRQCIPNAGAADICVMQGQLTFASASSSAQAGFWRSGLSHSQQDGTHEDIVCVGQIPLADMGCSIRVTQSQRVKAQSSRETNICLQHVEVSHYTVQTQQRPPEEAQNADKAVPAAHKLCSATATVTAMSPVIKTKSSLMFFIGLGLCVA